MQTCVWPIYSMSLFSHHCWANVRESRYRTDGVALTSVFLSYTWRVFVCVCGACAFFFFFHCGNYQSKAFNLRLMSVCSTRKAQRYTQISHNVKTTDGQNTDRLAAGKPWISHGSSFSETSLCFYYFLCPLCTWWLGLVHPPLNMFPFWTLYCASTPSDLFARIGLITWYWLTPELTCCQKNHSTEPFILHSGSPKPCYTQCFLLSSDINLAFMWIPNYPSRRPCRQNKDLMSQIEPTWFSHDQCHVLHQSVV